MTTLPQSVRFQDTELSVIDRDGTPWLTGPQIAGALGYIRPDSTERIYARNKDEFANDMTCTVKLTVQGQRRNVRVFSPRGAHLIAMFARTSRAKAFRQWVLDVLEAHAGQIDLPAVREIAVRAHTRRLAKGPTLPSRRGAALFFIDGMAVRVDTATWREGQRALVIRHDGAIAIERLSWVGEGRKAYGPWRRTDWPIANSKVRERITVIGRVMGEGA